MDARPGPDPEPVLAGPDPAVPAGRPGIAGALVLYTLARLALLAVVAGLLMLSGAPLLIAVLVGLIVALPLSMLLFRGLRARLDAAVGATRTRRAAERESLRSRLRGDAAPDDPSGEGAEREPDGRRD
jgi:hypothetical protein